MNQIQNSTGCGVIGRRLWCILLWPSGTVSWICHLVPRLLILTVSTHHFHLLILSLSLPINFHTLTSNSHHHTLARSTSNQFALLLCVPSILALSISNTCHNLQIYININTKRARGQELCWGESRVL